MDLCSGSAGIGLAFHEGRPKIYCRLYFRADLATWTCHARERSHHASERKLAGSGLSRLQIAYGFEGKAPARVFETYDGGFPLCTMRDGNGT